jgi:hypothetical protein
MSRSSGSVAMTNHEIALAVSAIAFGMFIGFLAGYAARAYVSYLHRRSMQGRRGYRIDGGGRAL